MAPFISQLEQDVNKEGPPPSPHKYRAMAKPYIFQDLAQRGRSVGVTPSMSRESRDWFREAGKSIRSVNVNRLMSGTVSRLQPRISYDDVGSLFHFWYDPKHKDTLPYWDQFPLCMPIEIYNDGHFLGLNFHYLSPYMRARLFDQLYNLAEVDESGKPTNIAASYSMLNSLSRFAPFKGCLKSYLPNHVRSYYFWIRPDEWDRALMLPTARFIGASHARVHRDSARRFR
jgi:hypothetical protein